MAEQQKPLNKQGEKSTPASTTMGEHSAFFYGTLMVPEILYRVIYGTSHPQNHPTFSLLSKNLTTSLALLGNYCRHRVQDCDYPGVIKQAGKSVLGVYVKGLTDGDLFRLGMFEGSEYTLMDVKVRVGKEGERLGVTEGGEGLGGEIKEGEGELVDTKTYVYTAGDEWLEKGEWDFEEFKREKLGRWVGEEEEYTEVDAAVKHESSSSDDSVSEYEKAGGLENDAEMEPQRETIREKNS